MKTKVIKLSFQNPDKGIIADAAKVIRQGGLVVFPTETVYGIGADFSNPQAIQRLKTVKQRSEDKPFSVLISEPEDVFRHTFFDKTIFYKLMDAYWPGPLTIVVPSKESGKTIGLRMPNHPIAAALIKETQCPIAAPSANLEGKPPALTCEAALKDLEGLVDVALDGGSVKLGVSSTVVDLSQESPKILREGIITQREIDVIARMKNILFVCTGNTCRSVMAQYLLKQAVKNRDDVEVASAGTAVFFSSPPSKETLLVLKELGVDASGHQANNLTSRMIKKADLIFVMSRAHRQYVLEKVPQADKRVYFVKEFVHSKEGLKEDLDIPDPIGTSEASYRQCAFIIKEAIQKIVDII